MLLSDLKIKGGEVAPTGTGKNTSSTCHFWLGKINTWETILPSLLHILLGAEKPFWLWQLIHAAQNV